MDPRVKELHCIMPIANMPSVLTHGILSHDNAARLEHKSVAMPEIQERRAGKAIPNGLRLHQYANLYFHARNPMMYLRRFRAHETCVLRISTKVLQLERVVITDQNAASDYARFFNPAFSHLLPWDDIFALDWSNQDDVIDYWRRKSRKCAEVLVPERVPPELLIGAYVVDVAAKDKLEGMGFRLPVTVNPDMFFG
jgi:hypothetical protein